MIPHRSAPGRSTSAAEDRNLWRQAFQQPAAVRLKRITKPIVQPVGAALPKFHLFRFQAESAPMWRQRHRFVGKALSDLRHPGIKHSAPIHHLALAGGPGAQLAPEWPRMKIALRFFTRSSYRLSTDSNLPI